MVRLVQRLLRHVTRYLTVDITAAATLTEGLERLRDGVWDMVLLDLELPECDGIDTFHQVHGACMIPIVVLTGVDDFDLRVECIEAGAQDCIDKMELTADVLLRSIRFAVERHRHVQEMQYALKELREAKITLEEIIEHLRERNN